MKNKYLAKLKGLVLTALREEEVKIILFGSRARGDNNVTSDVDIGFIPHGKVDKKKIILLREMIEQLNFPYKVELVNLSESSEDFKKEAVREGIVWKG